MPLFAFISWPTVTVLVAVAILLFGPSKIPDLARSLGEGLKELKKTASDLKKGVEEENGNKNS